MNQTDLSRQISFFKEMEACMRNSTIESDLDGPSRVMEQKLVRLQKAQEHTECTLEDIVMMVSDLTCGLSEIQHEPGITSEHIEELRKDIAKQEQEVDERASKVNALEQATDRIL